MRSRGYTLIEIAGVLVVCGILLGASLLPLNRQLRESEYRQERANMERVRDAVVGYALRHRTPGVEVIMVNDDGTQERGFYAPGRPYLPCPDGDGDGIEDRRDLISPVMQTLTRSFFPATPRRLDLAREQERQRILDLIDLGRATFADLPPPSREGFPGVGQFLENSPIRYSGACRFDKRQLPWRTLGSIPADYWGNRYTYFADPIFSQEATGFDEKTVADSGDRRVPLVIDPTFDYIPQNRIPVGGAPSQPSIICDIAEATESDLLCGRDGTVAALATLVAGEPAPSDAMSFLNSDPYVFQGRSNHIADGLPFVIVSHGHNGFGAYNHLNARRRASNEDLVCNSFDGANAQERVNLYVFIPTIPSTNDVGFETNACNVGEDGENFALPPDMRFRFSLRGILEGYFFAHRRSASAASAASSLSDRKKMDDLLVWMTRADLAQRMSEAGIFPLIVSDSDRPPIFYEPE